MHRCVHADTFSLCFLKHNPAFPYARPAGVLTVAWPAWPPRPQACSEDTSSQLMQRSSSSSNTATVFSHFWGFTVIPAVIFAVNWIKGWINFYCLFHRVAVTKSSWCSGGVVKMLLLKKKWCFVFFGWSRANKTENYRLLRPRCTTTLFSFCPKSTYPLEPGERFG